MRLLENVFTVLHIKISHIKVVGVSGRAFFTILLVLLMLFGSFQLAITDIQNDLISFLESALYVGFVLYCLFFWIKTWTRADKMLRRASDYEDQAYKKHK